MPLPWLDTLSPFPSADQAWGDDTDAPGLLAAGADLSVARLLDAYGQGIFPWFSEGQPVLWWSPTPRMVLRPQNFHIGRSFGKALRHFISTTNCEIRINHDFRTIIRHCAHARRKSQSGTWIVPAMQDAYTELHHAGHAHSVETWIDKQLVGGLYCVAIGKAVFGESMFSHQPDASKIALAALVALCRQQGVSGIDCQQVTSHLTSLGGAPEPREQFLREILDTSRATALDWRWMPLYWDTLGLSHHRRPCQI